MEVALSGSLSLGYSDTLIENREDQNAAHDAAALNPPVGAPTAVVSSDGEFVKPPRKDRSNDGSDAVACQTQEPLSLGTQGGIDAAVEE